LSKAAKFREETPRKGGGFVEGIHDTALQQYDGTGSERQGRKLLPWQFSPRKTCTFHIADPGFTGTCRDCGICAAQYMRENGEAALITRPDRPVALV
jgi:hypothetical protein